MTGCAQKHGGHVMSTGIVIRFGDNAPVTLSVEQARELHRQLDELFTPPRTPLSDLFPPPGEWRRWEYPDLSPGWMKPICLTGAVGE